jgi:hypothetical protein
VVKLLASHVLLPRIILRNIFWHVLEAEQTSGSWCSWKDQVHWIIFSHLMGTGTLGLLACSIVPQSSTLKSIQLIRTNTNKNSYYTLNSNSNEIHIVGNCYTCTSPWPSIHSTSLQLHSLHFHTLIYPSLTNFISCNFTSLHYIFYDLHHTFTSPDVSLS